MDLIQAVVVSEIKDSMDLLQRRVGGILKGIAVTGVCHFEQVDRVTAPLLICYAFGEHYYELKEKFQTRGRRVIGAELTLLPAGVRNLRLVPASVTLGVVAQHRRCANYFLSDIVRSGVMEHRFIIGTFDEMKDMPVDKFVVPEEMIAAVDRKGVSGEIITVPRTVSAFSAAEIINTALEVAMVKYRRKLAATPPGGITTAGA
ncbi:hypothetical protein [Desulfotomaculum copahuensis]|uniref:Uncharacterized protein n=1 Tax=Desulfotomaculum copahuensis TaxID=1838280 RepID=A0A1B7LI47_9FIRM|nr:hypothetical protein [Desulfotomaculum copahuensis]OAT86082.1 hypothetical protein A6M21_03935 [Desulfotomaculum copahuensis]